MFDFNAEVSVMYISFPDTALWRMLYFFLITLFTNAKQRSSGYKRNQDLM